MREAVLAEPDIAFIRDVTQRRRVSVWYLNPRCGMAAEQSLIPVRIRRRNGRSLGKGLANVHRPLQAYCEPRLHRSGTAS